MSSFKDKLRQKREGGGSGESKLPQSDATMELMEIMIGRKIRSEARETVVNALTVTEGGRLEFRGFGLTQVGIEAPDGANEGDWLELGQLLFQLEGGLQWMIGDWINYGGVQYGKTYEQIAEVFDRELPTLYNYALVSRAFEISLRSEILTFGHHQVLAAEPDEIKTLWLTYTANFYKPLSIKDMTADRRQLRGFDTTAQAQILQAAIEHGVRVDQIDIVARALESQARRGDGLPQDVKHFSLYVENALKARPLDEMNPREREEVAKRAERLAAWYGQIANQARGK